MDIEFVAIPVALSLKIEAHARQGHSHQGCGICAPVTAKIGRCAGLIVILYDCSSIRRY